MARTLFFEVFRKALRRAAQEGSPPDPGMAGVSRRGVLKGAGAAGAYAVLPPIPTGPLRPAKVAVVGAGLAGLACASRLAEAGVDVTVYEASPRVGGRVWSGRDLMGEGLITELGAEFINSDHADIRALAESLGLALLDREAPEETGLTEGFFFGGRRLGEEELVAALRPVAPRFAADARSVEEDEDRAGVALDRTPLADYLRAAGVRGELHAVFDAVMVPEFGLEMSDQSTLNLLGLMPGVRNGKPALLGGSDERFKVVGGNDRIATGLAERLGGRIRTGMPLAGLAANGRRALLRFAGGGEAEADLAVVTVPFNLLRALDLQMEMPRTLRRYIDELGYGSNAKVLAGFADRPWRRAGSSGQLYSDTGFQSCWDNSLGQPGSAGGVTFFLGGIAGLTAGEGPAAERADEMTTQLDRAIPGIAAARSARSGRFHWPSYGFARGSYACLKPGQYTGFFRHHAWREGEDGKQECVAGNVLFAGEHTSDAFQGYMNGAAQTGRLAADAVLARLS